MYFKRQEIVAKINEISQERNLHDNALSKLQLMLRTHKKHSIVQLRKDFDASVQNLNKISRENHSVLQLLRKRSQKLMQEGVQMKNQLIKIAALQQYFDLLKKNVDIERTKGQEIIRGREKWQIMQNANVNETNDEEEGLLGSRRAMKETKQMAVNVYENVTSQGSRIEQARVKMGSVLKNINFAGNIAQMLRTRTAEDNRLIVKLSIGLLIEILLCLFVIKPWWKG